MKKVWIKILLIIALIWIGMFLWFKIENQFTLSEYLFEVGVFTIVFIILGVIDSVKILKTNYQTVKLMLKFTFKHRKMNTFEMWDTSNVIRFLYGGTIKQIIDGAGTGNRVIYYGKEFREYDIDQSASTILLVSGDKASEQYGFVREEPEISTCFKKGKYKYLASGNYYKEIDVMEAEDIYYVMFMAVYHGINCKPDFIPGTDEINLTVDPGIKGKLDLDHRHMQRLGFKPVHLGDHQWEDREGYFKSGVKYNDAKLKIIKRKIYAGKDKMAAPLNKCPALSAEPKEEMEIMRVGH